MQINYSGTYNGLIIKLLNKTTKITSYTCSDWNTMFSMFDLFLYTQYYCLYIVNKPFKRTSKYTATVCFTGFLWRPEAGFFSRCSRCIFEVTFQHVRAQNTPF